MSVPAPRTTEEIQAAESHAFALSALDAIHAVKTPEEAEHLLARVKVAAEAARVMHLGKALSREWRGVEIKAERRWGELLGEAEPGRPSGGIVTDSNDLPRAPAERKAAHEARKLAAVPAELVEEYVEKTEAPTKAGLLRKAEAKRDIHAEFALVDPGVAKAVAFRDSSRVLAPIQKRIFDLRHIDLAACEAVLGGSDRDRLQRLLSDCDRALVQIAHLRAAAAERLQPVRSVS